MAISLCSYVLELGQKLNKQVNFDLMTGQNEQSGVTVVSWNISLKATNVHMMTLVEKLGE